MNNYFGGILILVGTLFAVSCYAATCGKDFFGDHATGWHWYDDPKAELIEEETASLQNDPVKQMNAVRATLERAQNKMVLQPNKENVKNYIRIQNQISENASKLSQTWREVLLENPELDFSLIHPTNNVAKQVENDLQSQKENTAIRTLAKKSGLFFFYRSSCHYCVRFAPILKDFADTYGITVIAITTDGKSVPEFPNSRLDQGQSIIFHVKAEPALFVVNPYTHQAIPVSYGLTSEADLKRRILDIAKREKGNDQ